MMGFPMPRHDEIHLYSFDLADFTTDLSCYENYLSTEELRRADRFKGTEPRQQFLMSRWKLRTLLARYLDCTPEAVAICIGVNGKPSLANSPSPLCFNLAHSGSKLLCAFTRSHGVGIDMEYMDTQRPVTRMAQLVFSPRELADLQATETAAQAALFYRYWVRREACLKAAGGGFSLPWSTDFDICGSYDSPHGVTINQNGFRFQVIDIAAPEHYCAAVAITGHHPLQPKPLWMADTVTDYRGNKEYST